MFNKSWIILSLIFVIGAFLRVFMFLQVPPALNWDEASLGYNAYSILQTGKDEWGRSIPVSFEAFGDFKLPVYIYTLVPVVRILGLQEISVRLPSLISGLLAIIFIYLIAFKLTKQKTVALLSSFLLAISSTHIFLSRIALEANLALGVFLGGLCLFLFGIDRNSKYKNYFLPVSFLLFGLTLFTYNSARVFIPLFIFCLVIIYRKSFFNNKILGFFSLSLFLVITLYAGYLAIFVDSSSRYFWVSIVDQGAINFLNEARGNSTWPELVTKLIYNKQTYFIVHFLQNYLQHFSLNYLLLEGGQHAQFSLPHHGVLYFTEIIFFFAGLIALIKKYKETFAWVLLAWILIALIPAAVTRESPHVLRAIFMLGALQIIISLGIVYIINSYLLRFKKVVLGVVITGVIVESLIFSFKYFYEYPVQYSQSWQYGMKQAIAQIDKYSNSDSSKPIFITKKYGEPHIFYLFFNKYNPESYQNNPTLIRYDRTNWRWVDRLDNIYFINDWDVKEKTQDKIGSLLITSPDNYPSGSKILDSIYFLDGERAFDIVEIGENNEKVD